jgi:hypothetical protein
MKIELENGKYEVVWDEKAMEFYANRYSQRWRELAGDKLVLAMMYRIEELQEQINSKESVDSKAADRFYATYRRD